VCYAHTRESHVERRPIDIFDEVNSHLDAVENPPLGLVVHFAHQLTEDQVRAVDIWESLEAHDSFDGAHDPAAVLRDILSRRGLAPPQLVSRDVTEVRALIREHAPR